MTVKETAEKLGLNLLAGEEGAQRTIECVYSCDLLSFVMGRAPAGSAWVTVMGNVNAVAVASLCDVACIVLAENAEANEEMLSRAEQQGIPVLTSKFPVYDTAKKIDQIAL